MRVYLSWQRGRCLIRTCYVYIHLYAVNRRAMAWSEGQKKAPKRLKGLSRGQNRAHSPSSQSAFRLPVARARLWGDLRATSRNRKNLRIGTLGWEGEPARARRVGALGLLAFNPHTRSKHIERVSARRMHFAD
jgi:hypothetical protein